MKKLFIAVALCLVGLTFAASCDAPSTELKVMSFNIRLGVANDGDNSWDIRKPAVAEMLNTINPVMFGVQECFDFQREYILENCPQFSCVGVGREDGISQGEHMSVFYNTEAIEMLEWGTYWLSETPEVPSMGWDAACYRTATWSKVREKASGKEFYFCNTHLDHVGKDARRNGLSLIVERIAAMNPEGLPMILTGDFNVTPDDPCLDDLEQIMLNSRYTAKDSDTRTSYNGWGKAASEIDYIWYKGFDECLSFKVITDEFAGKPFVSDHYPVVAILK